MLMHARNRALTSSNILAAFQATGISPMNRRRVLQNPPSSLQIEHSITPPLPPIHLLQLLSYPS